MVDRARLTPQEHAAAAASWAHDTPVPQPPQADRLVHLLESIRSLGAVRRQVRAFLRAGLPDDAGEAAEDAVEHAVLVIDELTSNALRHGRPPSRLQVCDEPDRWIVVVSDAAPERMPTPAVERPAGAGGYGLHLVADLTGAHGVHYETDQKLVWACLEKPGR
ncbi:Histidine kinase-like ATPase domain-containing protein [Klenkia soli]|uniref:Histidine kinase-like ATPase domain-containing protein n=1 Tax=Klenkia soli TaxID=1052260 RepID=A0A1H0E3F5_9ACTN|nr:ATP-binding protein [Klenkia soli]SDN76818.1 Histidine kinase-like ATPase domain-containing protein [Klenkia soli]